MRSAWINATEALRERMMQPAQVESTDAEAEMPPYMESFLAHLRLLVGVPFDNLIPDARLLPDESIRFFYMDRSWTDRVVDGAVAVGKIGTREQSHHQAHEPAVRQQLDLSERIVRPLQRRLDSFQNLKSGNDQVRKSADTITGFLLRSAAVSGWPHMDVRAYDRIFEEPFEPSNPKVKSHQLETLRLERLSPAVLFALFQGIPQMVIVEEPHHGVQFGVHQSRTGWGIDLRQSDGHQILDAAHNPKSITVPVRAANNRVIAVAELRRRLYQAQQSEPTMAQQTGSANFAVEVLNPPWRQHFEGTRDNAHNPTAKSGGFVSGIAVAKRIADEQVKTEVLNLVKFHGGV